MFNCKIKEMGGVFSVGRIYNDVEQPPVVQQHNALLGNFLERPLNNMTIWGGITKIGKSNAPNSANMSALQDAIVSGTNSISDICSISLKSKTVEFDEELRLLSIHQEYRTTYVGTAITGEIWEIGHSWFHDANSALVNSRAVLPQAVTLDGADALYVDYVMDLVVELPPATAPMTIEYPDGPFNTTVNFRIEDLDAITAENIFKPMDTYELTASAFPLSNNHGHILQWNDAPYPKKTRNAVGKVLTVTQEYDTTMFNTAPGGGAQYQGVITVVQANANFSFTFDPPIPKNDQITLTFTFVHDWSGLVTL